MNNFIDVSIAILLILIASIGAMAFMEDSASSTQRQIHRVQQQTYAISASDEIINNPQEMGMYDDIGNRIIPQTIDLSKTASLACVVVKKLDGSVEKGDCEGEIVVRRMVFTEKYAEERILEVYV